MKKIKIFSLISIIAIGFLIFGLYYYINKDKNNNENNEEEEEPENPDPYSFLPYISTFLTQKSDQFIVDIEDICDGHPYKGKNANSPHCGAHAHFNNIANTWPKGPDIPENYPKIYTPIDGIVTRVDYTYPIGPNNDRYGIDIAFARKNNGSVLLFSFSIEPMDKEPSQDFYRDFILVSENQYVTKGDIIAYMYTPPNGNFGIHIHFHIAEMFGSFMAPAIFNSTITNQFHAKWDLFGDDNGVIMPPCMGYKLTAEENPFGTGAVDVL